MPFFHPLPILENTFLPTFYSGMRIIEFRYDLFYKLIAQDDLIKGKWRGVAHILFILVLLPKIKISKSPLTFS